MSDEEAFEIGKKAWKRLELYPSFSWVPTPEELGEDKFNLLLRNSWISIERIQVDSDGNNWMLWERIMSQTPNCKYWESPEIFCIRRDFICGLERFWSRLTTLCGEYCQSVEVLLELLPYCFNLKVLKLAKFPSSNHQILLLRKSISKNCPKVKIIRN